MSNGEKLASFIVKKQLFFKKEKKTFNRLP